MIVRQSSRASSSFSHALIGLFSTDGPLCPDFLRWRHQNLSYLALNDVKACRNTFYANTIPFEELSWNFCFQTVFGMPSQCA